MTASNLPVNRLIDLQPKVTELVQGDTERREVSRREYSVLIPKVTAPEQTTANLEVDRAQILQFRNQGPAMLETEISGHTKGDAAIDPSLGDGSLGEFTTAELEEGLHRRDRAGQLNGIAYELSHTIEEESSVAFILVSCGMGTERNQEEFGKVPSLGRHIALSRTREGSSQSQKKT